MNDHTLQPTDAGRLVKALLPAGVVRAMDAFIEKSGAYADRNEFLADAIQGHLAELLGGTERQTTVRRERSVSPEPSPVAFGLGILTPLPPEVPTMDVDGSTSAGPTWGMHNRDFPTLWAAAHLGTAAAKAGRHLAFTDWSKDVIAAAWQLARALDGSRFDTSGFPSNDSKPGASEGRFMRFFVGVVGGTGPLFDLGLAGSRDGEVAVTTNGLRLLRALEGFGCDPDQEVRVAWSRSFLSHLARHAPADLRFMRLVLDLVLAGNSSRTELVEAAGVQHPDWSDAVLATNVAGYVARAREWGLMARKQEQGRYVVNDGAMDLLEQVAGGKS
jgi:hypothetical protein